MLKRAEDRIDSLVQLIGDLLSLSRSEQAPSAEPGCWTSQPGGRGGPGRPGRADWPPADITARAELEPDLPPVLLPHGDLDLILSNLVGNAVKYNRDGGSVTVRARREAEWVRIDVEDTGIGIAKENLDLVLTEFFREKRPETRDIEGSGLGLAIVKRLVERAGGRLEVASEAGRGLDLLGAAAGLEGFPTRGPSPPPVWPTTPPRRRSHSAFAHDTVPARGSGTEPA